MNLFFILTKKKKTHLEEGLFVLITSKPLFFVYEKYSFLSTNLL